MFNYTNTLVINSNYDLSTNLPLWSLGEDKDGNVTFHVKGINNFNALNVTKVFKAPYTEPKLAQVEIDFSKLTSSDFEKNDTLRLSIYIRLTEADQCSYYANDTRYKGKPFTIEFPWLGNAADTLKNVIRLIRKYGLLVFEKEVIKAEQNGNKLVLTAVNEFQRFYTIKLEKYLDPDGPYKPEWKDVTGTTVEVVEEGLEGFGTYGWLLRNIKLPTHVHTTAFSVKQNEMPIPGAHYNQYTLHYCVNRGPLGLNAVGDTVKSVTTHVFYVNTALLEDTSVDADKTGASDFETAIKALADAADADAWEVVDPNA